MHSQIGYYTVAKERIIQPEGGQPVYPLTRRDGKVIPHNPKFAEQLLKTSDQVAQAFENNGLKNAHLASPEQIKAHKAYRKVSNPRVLLTGWRNLTDDEWNLFKEWYLANWQNATTKGKRVDQDFGNLSTIGADDIISRLSDQTKEKERALQAKDKELEDLKAQLAKLQSGSQVGQKSLANVGEKGEGK